MRSGGGADQQPILAITRHLEDADASVVGGIDAIRAAPLAEGQAALVVRVYDQVRVLVSEQLPRALWREAALHAVSRHEWVCLSYACAAARGWLAVAPASRQAASA